MVLLLLVLLSVPSLLRKASFLVLCFQEEDLTHNTTGKDTESLYLAKLFSLIDKEGATAHTEEVTTMINSLNITTTTRNRKQYLTSFNISLLRFIFSIITHLTEEVTVIVAKDLPLK